jgi:predicted RNase H-like HicB family nuclease
MKPEVIPLGSLVSPLVRVGQEAEGQFTAHVVGLPEIQATAATREAVIEQVRALLAQWLSAGRLVSLAMPAQLPLSRPAGWAKEDRLEQEFLNDLARYRQEDLERTLREYEQEDQGCSSTSSTPTT